MSYIGGLYTGLEYIAGAVNDDAQVKTLDDFLKSAVDARKTDSIVSIFMMPTAFYTNETSPKVKNVAIETKWKYT